MDSTLSAVPQELVTHHDAFASYIASQPPHNHRISMSLRKLSQFTLVHFIELSTDIYDELLRRVDPASGPGEHLPARQDIHPKRNHARYQLGDLSDDRFGDMCKDLMAEHERRFPEFIEYEIQKESETAQTDNNAIPQTVYSATVEPTKSVMIEDDDGSDSEDSGVEYSDYETPTPQIGPNAHTVDDMETEEWENPIKPSKQLIEEPVQEPALKKIENPAMDIAEDSVKPRRVPGAHVTIQSPITSPAVGGPSVSRFFDQDEQISDLVKECTSLEQRVHELEQSMAELETVKNNAVEENNHLHDMLKDAHELNAQKDKEIEQLHSAAPVAKDLEEPEDENKPSYEELLAQLAEQQKVTEQVRSEASSFLEEMRALTETRSQEDDKQRALIRDLRAEIDEWKSRYSELTETMRENGGIVAMPSLDAQLQYFDDNGKISFAAAREFRSAIDTLVVDARTRPESLLDLLHDVVLATRRISREAGEQDVRYNTYTRLISRTANQLISVVRNMTVAGGLLPFLLLDAACSDLGFAVVELFKAARLRPEEVSGLRISMPPPAEAEPTAPVEPLAPRNIEPPSPEASPEVESPKKAVQETKDTFIVPALPPDSSIAELQTYLEEQTSETVDSIQSLLSGIRDNEKVVDLKPKVQQISVLVRRMLEATGSSMAQTRNWLLRDKGSFILQNLGDCSSRMEALYDELDRLDAEGHAKRQLKQRLAGVSFDMAKSTKELVKTVEEVSIKSEIEQIEMQLSTPS